MKNTIYNAKIVLPDRIIPKGYVVWEDGKILEVGEGECSLSGTDAQGRYLSPGFVDIHCHGGGNSDFMDGDEDSFVVPATLHAKHGTTTLVPTVTTGPSEDMICAFEGYHRAKTLDYKGARLEGIHMEGPYFSLEQAGAQDPRHIRAPRREDYENFVKCSKGSILRWTLAPELEGSKEFIEYLKKQGILISIGHSNAVFSEVEAAFESGATLVTHLYSGMSTITRVNGYRRSGVLESAYIIDDMNVEVIADGHHLPRELLLMVYKFKGADRVALVTDSMRGAGMPDGRTVLGNRETGLECIIEGGVAKLPDRSAFAGSVCTADRLVRTMYKTVGVPLVDAVKMMTLTPARFIKVDSCRGKIEKGFDADLVVFDDDINVFMTVVDGKTVYEK